MLGFNRHKNQTEKLPVADSGVAQPVSEPEPLMKPVRHPRLRALLRLGITIAVTMLLFSAPRLSQLPIKAAKQVSCKNQTASGYTPSTVKDVVLGHGLTNKPNVTLDGTVTYSPASGTFFLRDDAFIVSLDMSGCEKFDTYKSTDILVLIKGTGSITDGRSRVAVDGIHVSAPVWAQIFYNAGSLIALGLIFYLFLAALKGLVALIRWLLVLIGLRQPKKPKPEKSVEEILERDAGLSLLVGAAAWILWLLNPVIGLAYQLYGLYQARQGLRSTKRKVALIGLILGVASLILMPLILGSNGMFAKTPEPNFYHSQLESF